MATDTRRSGVGEPAPMSREDAEQAIRQMRTAIQALRLEVPSPIADDVFNRFEAVVRAISGAAPPDDLRQNEDARKTHRSDPREWGGPVSEERVATYDELILALRNVMAYTRRALHRGTINEEDAGHLLRFCAEVGVKPSILRAGTPASGQEKAP